MTEDVHSPPRRRWARRLLLRASRLTLLLTGLIVILWTTGCMERLFYYPETGLTPPPVGHPGAESVSFTSADGTKLHGWFIPARPAAPGADTGDRLGPSILHVHGNAGNITSHLPFTEYLPAAGYNLFIFDFRGYGQSEGKAHKRAALVADTNAALDALLARPEVDPKAVGLFGQSLGGSIGLNVMADRPEIRAAVIMSAFTSWREVASQAVGGESPGWCARTLATLLINDTLRPIDAADRITRPMLFIHGTADRIVPPVNATRLADAAGDHGSLLVVEGGDHNGLRWQHPEIDGVTLDFFAQHLVNDR